MPMLFALTPQGDKILKRLLLLSGYYFQVMVGRKD